MGKEYCVDFKGIFMEPRSESSQHPKRRYLEKVFWLCGISNSLCKLLLVEFVLSEDYRIPTDLDAPIEVYFLACNYILEMTDSICGSRAISHNCIS